MTKGGCLNNQMVLAQVSRIPMLCILYGVKHINILALAYDTGMEKTLNIFPSTIFASLI